MSEEAEEFPYPVEICDMTWFSQVGLFLNCSDRKNGSWVHKNNVQGIVQIHEGVWLKTNTAPFLYTGYGPMSFRDDVRAWLDENGWSYKFGRTPCDWNCQCKGVVRFKDSTHAMIFKLTWGGSV